MSLAMKLASLSATLLAASALRAQMFPVGDVTFFEAKIRPLLASKCLGCHAGSPKSPRANLALDSRAAILKGGDSGPAAVAGDPASSRIMQAIRYEGPQMPPSGKLPADQIALIEQWIAKGLPWPAESAGAPDSATPAPAARPRAAATKRWAWEPLHASAPPVVRDAAVAPTAIDRFIEAKLEAVNLKTAVPADRRTLLRRLSIDLTGLAPTYAEVQAFENDRRPDAYDRQVDRLLASQHFGERWGRHWLDLARYADSGTLGIRFPLAITYRDWVIDAFNRDLPYDRFVTLQLAADQVDLHNQPQDLAALGFITLGNDLYRATELPDRVDDRIDVVTRGLLALTVSCARCHDHKYDPIPTRDYYALYGVFANTQLLGFPKTIAAVAKTGTASWYESRIALRAKGLEDYRSERLKAIRDDYRQPAEMEKYGKAAEEAHALSSARRDGYAREHNLNAYMLERWVRSLDNHDDPTDVPAEDFGYVMTEGDSNTTRELRKEYEQMLSDFAWRGSKARVISLADEHTIRPAHVLTRGNLNDPGEETPPCFVSVLSRGDPACFTHGSGRAELANSILHGPVPIASRTMVNRVWGHLFGEGLIRSVSDFGSRGEEPTHPELLDYLAAQYQRDGWSTKRLIRAIVLSAAYRRASNASPEALTKDPENRMLSHTNRRRLDFESLRDSMLLCAGRLDTTVGGKPISLTTLPADPRRTVYTYIERERPLPLLKIFDVADPEQHTPARGMTVVPQQALFLMNSPFLQEMSSSVDQSIGASSEFAAELFRRVLARDASADERNLIAALAEREPASPGPRSESAWRYGAVSFDLAAGRLKEFRPFRYFTGTAWQPSSMLPDAIEGMASITAVGGSPGDGLDSAVSRRWIAPRDMTVRVTSTLLQRRNQFAQRFLWTNGVRGSLVSSGGGLIGQWLVDGPSSGAKIVEQDESKAVANVERITVKAGDTLDFVVDSRDDPELDSFTWKIRIEDAGGGEKWDSERDFQGPPVRPLTSRARAAQVLLMSNEFAFVD
jgi:hypothetical protein